MNRHASATSTATIDGIVSPLLREHRNLVLEIATRHARPGVDPTRVVQAGIRGLVDAASRFDGSCGSFADFAAWWVRRRICECVSHAV